MAEKLKCDLAVLGGGPGGYTAAFRAADLGLSVCLIEERPKLGGVCLHAGCIPSKTLLHAASIVETVRRAGAFGLHYPAPEIDLDVLRSKKDDIVRQLAEGLDKLCKARRIRRLTGRGRFRDAHTLRVASEEQEAEVVFNRVIIATGSRPASLPDAPEDPRIWDSGDALRLSGVPKRLLVVGGGIIGLEMAQVYKALGAEITLVEMGDHLIPAADKDLLQPLMRTLKEGCRIMTGARVAAMAPGDRDIQVDFSGTDTGETGHFDAVLTAIGRRPNTEGIGLDALGLKVGEHGFIPVDERQQTAVAQCYAIGDVVGEPMLAHKASHQAKIAAEVIAGRKAAFTPMTIPSVVYTSPELAWMGITERQARERGIDYARGSFPWKGSGRALCSDAANGVSKLLFDRATGRIIGAGVCGSQAGELIHEVVLALEMGADAEDIGRTVHAHPTLSETIALAAEMVAGSITDAVPPKR